MNAGKSLPTTLSGWLTGFAIFGVITVALVVYGVTTHGIRERFWWWLGLAWLMTLGLFLDWFLIDRKRGR